MRAGGGFRYASGLSYIDSYVTCAKSTMFPVPAWVENAPGKGKELSAFSVNTLGFCKYCKYISFRNSLYIGFEQHGLCSYFINSNYRSKYLDVQLAAH